VTAVYPVDTSAPLSARSVYTPIIEVLLGNCEVAAISEDVGFEVPCIPVEVLPVEIVVVLVEVLVEAVVEEDVGELLIELVDALVDSVGVLSVVLEVVPGGELVWLVVEALLEDWVDAVPTELEIVLAVVDPVSPPPFVRPTERVLVVWRANWSPEAGCHPEPLSRPYPETEQGRRPRPPM
jgi:hypothetical protein